MNGMILPPPPPPNTDNILSTTPTSSGITQQLSPSNRNMLCLTVYTVIMQLLRVKLSRDSGDRESEV